MGLLVFGAGQRNVLPVVSQPLKHSFVCSYLSLVSIVLSLAFRFQVSSVSCFQLPTPAVSDFEKTVYAL